MCKEQCKLAVYFRLAFLCYIKILHYTILRGRSDNPQQKVKFTSKVSLNVKGLGKAVNQFWKTKK